MTDASSPCSVIVPPDALLPSVDDVAACQLTADRVAAAAAAAAAAATTRIRDSFASSCLASSHLTHKRRPSGDGT